jgi:hypothetical protein
VIWRWSPAGGLLLAGAVLVVLAIAFVWRRRATTTIASLLAVLLGAVLWSVCSALELSAGDLEDAVFMELLTLVYGNSVLNVCEDMERRSRRIARAWAPLFERRHDHRVAPIQFALAGLNAHTNHDVPIGLVHACRSTNIAPDSDGPQYRDYMKMTTLLKRTTEQVKKWLVTGALEEVDQSFGDVDDAIAMWSLQRARQAAWTSGEVLWALRDNDRLTVAYVSVMDRMTGFAGRGLLVPTAL